MTLLSPFVAKKRPAGTLGQRLQALLAEQERSVTWLAEQIGQHRVNVSRIVNDRSPDPPLSTLRALAGALGVTVGDLVDEPG